MDTVFMKYSHVYLVDEVLCVILSCISLSSWNTVCNALLYLSCWWKRDTREYYTQYFINKVYMRVFHQQGIHMTVLCMSLIRYIRYVFINKDTYASTIRVRLLLYQQGIHVSISSTRYTCDSTYEGITHMDTLLIMWHYSGFEKTWPSFSEIRSWKLP